MGAKILIWDIETFPNIMARFSLWHQGDPNSILKEGSIICASYKWLGEKKVHTISVRDHKSKFKKDHCDDSHVLKEMTKVISEADMIIHHNGDKFDMKVLNARLAANDLPPCPPVLMYDTLKVAKKFFKFNSNRLDYLGKLLKVGGKMDTPKGLWIECLRGDTKAIAKMEDYNKRDVDLLEAVYNKLKIYDTMHPNMNIMEGDEDSAACPLCKSKDVVKWGYVSTKLSRFRRYRCKDCGKYSKARKAKPLPNKVELR